MKNRIRCQMIYTFCLFLFLALSSPTIAQDDPFLLIGEITGSSGGGKPGVRVNFEPGRYSAMTDRNGRFVVRSILPGSYTITVRKGPKNQQFKKQIEMDDKIDLRVNW